MTTKDYKIIAWAISNAKYSFDPIGSDQIEALERVALYLADSLEAENPHFIRSTFLEAAFAKPTEYPWNKYPVRFK